jgi:hypothetical protein
LPPVSREIIGDRQPRYVKYLVLTISD